MRSAFYLVVVTLGVLSMGFQLLASRLLNPHFGSSIIVWAWLISTFLAAFSIGSITGGWISHLPADRRHRAERLAALIAILSLAVTAVAGRALLGVVEEALPDPNVALLVSCVGLFFVPVAALSCFGPLSVQLLASQGVPPGQASGLIYGISTLGNIAGVMLTAFVLIPNARVSTLLLIWLGVAILGLAILLNLLRRTP